MNEIKKIESSTKEIWDSNIPIEKYIAFFNYAPISLWLEDFSKAKKYLDTKTKKLNITTEKYLKENPGILPKLASLVSIKDVNYKTLELYKAASKEELFKNLTSVFTPESTIGFSKLLVQLLSGKKAAELTTVNRNLEGEKIDVIIRFNAFDNINESLENVIVSIEDITEKTKDKEALQKSEAKYKDLFEKSHDAIMIVDEQGDYIDCNEATLKLYACDSKEDIIGKTTIDFSPEFQPTGENSREISNKVGKIAIEKGSHKFEFYHKDNNGRVFPTEISLTRIIDNDNSIKIHGIVRDITERKKKEKLEKVVFNIANAALAIHDFKEFGEFIKNELHKIIDTNNFFIALYNEENDTINTPFIIDEYNYNAQDTPSKGTLTDYVIKTKKPLKVNIEQHNKLIDEGKVKMIDSVSKIWVGAPLKTKNKVFGAIVVQSYISEDAYSENDVELLEFVANQISSAIQIKNSQDELEKALLKAQESDRLKSAFLANMSHEIRTPMNGIIGFSELISNKNISEKERQSYAKIVIKSSKQLLSIVNDILDISKIEAGIIQIHNEDVKINELLDELYTFYNPKAIKNNIEFTLDKTLDNLHCILKIDRTKLKQVFDNLLSNAFKFTNSGSIKFGYNLLNDKYLEFYVKDTGIGIDKDLQPKIFDRFIQADIKNKHKGTGLGLAISKNFIELFGGKISLESNSEGTNISFTIPFSIKQIDEENKSITKQEKITNVKDKDLTILVAEDEEYNMLYINELFSTTKFKIIEADNGLSAVKIAKNNPAIDLILMDIKMPKLNGYDAMKMIKKNNPEIPIIALSAFAMESEKETAIGKGFDSYLTKPINRNLLFEIINKFTN